jgi:hypothetical protein
MKNKKKKTKGMGRVKRRMKIKSTMRRGKAEGKD